MIEKGKNRKKSEIDFIFCSTLWIRTINNAVEQCPTMEKTNLNDKAKFATTGENNLSYEFVFFN